METKEVITKEEKRNLYKFKLLGRQKETTKYCEWDKTDRLRWKQARTGNENKAALTLGLSDSIKGELFPILSGKNYAGTAHGEALGETQKHISPWRNPLARHQEHRGAARSPTALLCWAIQCGPPQSPANTVNNAGRQQRLTDWMKMLAQHCFVFF